ncbi:MAG: peptide chain release factor N(5)-glutamine methyltransferase, partial [Actinobacteria bacterium]|nr:peptide chain release factor N(5)-glutamine methyltransferase [Actinomycetota bacterium]
MWAEAQAALGSSLDGRRIVERASGYDGAELLLHLDEPTPARTIDFAEEMVSRRARGEPLQYVLGRWGFRQLDLLIDRRVLIPRPETEVVVDVLLAEVRGMALGRAPVVVDLGTGSGAIALSVAREAGARVWATDRSPAALAVARANLAGLGSAPASRVRLLEGHWFGALPPELLGGVDAIVSNPPYVAAGDDLPPEVRDWEPTEALVAGPTGLEDVAQIIEEAPLWLSQPGVLVVEVAPDQADTAAAMARNAGFADVDVRRDLQDRLRMV